jgi:hypothetical protein
LLYDVVQALTSLTLMFRVVAVYPRRQLWTSYWPPWELEISHLWLWLRTVYRI